MLSSNYDREKFIERLVKDGFVENHLLTATTVNGEMIHSIISSVTINSDGRRVFFSMIVDRKTRATSAVPENGGYGSAGGRGCP